MRIAMLAVVVAATTTIAQAAPPVRLVQSWLPGLDREPIAAMTKRVGVAFLDHSPDAAPLPDHAGAVTAAIEAYDALRLDDAWQILERTRQAVDASGGGLSRVALSDLFVYRALVRTQRGDGPGAWDEWIAAATVAPDRVLDPARFSPAVIADHARARATVAAAPTVDLTFTGGQGCAVTLDGAAVALTATVAAGRHWVRATCPAAEPWTAHPVWGGPTAVVAIAPVRAAAPSDDELLVIARGSGVGAFVAVAAQGAVVTARRIGADGRVEATRAVALSAGTPAIAAAVEALLAPPGRASAPWYRSRWAWALGAAGLTAAIVVPLTIALAGGGEAQGATIVGPGGAL